MERKPVRIRVIVVFEDCTVCTFTEIRSWKHAVERALDESLDALKVDHVLFNDLNDRGGIQRFTVNQLQEDLLAGRVPE